MTTDRFTRIVTTISVVIVVWALVVGFAASAVDVRAEQTQAGDDWVDNCEEAETITESGTYNGTIDTPFDVDVLGVELPEKGAYVTVQLLVPTTEGEFAIEPVGIVSVGNKQFDEGIRDSTAVDHQFDTPGITILADERAGIENSSFAVFAEEPGRACVGFYERNPETATLPYEWQVTLTFNAAGEANLPGEILSPREVAQYRQDIRTLSERVTELENTAEDLEQRVANLEQRVSDLESELANETTTTATETAAPERVAPNRNPAAGLVPAIAFVGGTTLAIRKWS